MDKEICVFCGKGKDEVGEMISNNKVGICGKCICICSNLLEEKIGAVEYAKLRYEMRYGNRR